jgi:predicted DNA-binding protein (UPF0251 family)
MHAEIIDLVYHHGKSVKEAARIVDVSEATVKMRMLYARRKLAQFLKDCTPMTIHLAGRDRTAKDGRPRAARRLARSTNFRNLR